MLLARAASRSSRTRSSSAQMLNCLRTPAPPLLPLYTLKRQEIGPGEFTSSYVDYPGTHPTFHKYHLLNLFRDVKESACRCHMITPNEQ